MGAWVRGGGVRLGGQGCWEQRSEACVKIQKKFFFFFFFWGGGGGGGGTGWGGGQGGCEWRTEAFVKIIIFFFFFGGGGVGSGGGGSGWGVRVDGNGELKLL